MAQDLDQLGSEIEAYVGPDARAALLHWRAELLSAADEIERHAAANVEPS